MFQKHSARLRCVLLLTVLETLSSGAATVTWDGGGGNFSWQTAANWSGDILPGVNDDVVINVSSNITVTSGASVTVRSLQCSNNLAVSGGTFRVTSGTSIVQGAVSISGNPVLSASGAGATFIFAAATNVNGAGAEALNGAILSFPVLASYSKGAGCVAPVWQASGANSVLDAPVLTNLTGATCASLTVQALSGGVVSMPDLARISEGTLFATADGTNSTINFPALQQTDGVSYSVTFEARNHGTILTPQFVGGRTATVSMRSGGTLPIEQLRQLAGFTISGTNANFVALTNLTDGNITVSSNAVVTVTNLAGHNGAMSCYVSSWVVTGAGSVLNFSGLTSLSGASCGSRQVSATAGGTFILSNLTSVAEGTLVFSANGSNSVVDLSGLQESDATLRNVLFEAENSGTILMPQFVGGGKVLVTIASGGNLPVPQLRELSGFTVSGANVAFPALTNLTFGNLTVNGGAVVSLPSLTSHSQLDTCTLNTWEVSGAGSVLDLSALTSLTGASCGFHNVSATGGGRLLLNNLPALGDGTINFTANGANSVIEFGALSHTAGSRIVNFSAANQAEIELPQLQGNSNVFVSLESGGILPVSQFGRLHGFNVAGMTVSFSALTNLSSGPVTVSGGGSVSAPNLRRHLTPAGCNSPTWLATGSGSVLDFSSLTNLAGASCGSFNIQAAAGGQVLLGGLGSVGEGVLGFLADGAGSRIDLPSLTNSLSANATVSFEARSSGTLSVPVLQGGPTVTITIRSGGALDTAELKLLKSLTVSGTNLDLPGITNLFAGDVIVEQGATLKLPNLFSHNQGNGCIVNSWTVTGANSALELNSMTNLVGSTCGVLMINALAGGALNLSNLVAISDGAVAFVVDGTNSGIDLSRLERSRGSTFAVSFEARNSGRFSMPQMAGGPTVAIVIKTNGVLPTANLETLKSITVLATNATFAMLTNIDTGWFSVTHGGSVTAPALTAYQKGLDCIATTWLASGTGSVLNLPALAQMTGGTCQPLSLQATNGGQILLGALGAIPSGTVLIEAWGTNSVVDVSAMTNFIHAANSSRLTATNSGSILLNAGPLFLSGVTLSFASSTPEFGTLNFGPTNLLMRAQPWRSYWVEYRDPVSVSNAWRFFQRVPQTNEFQIISPSVNVSTEFRGWEFVAEPYLLDLAVKSTNAELVLFAPTGHTLEIQSATNLEPGAVWQTFDTVALTNTFRILTPRPANQLKEFFRAKAL